MELRAEVEATVLKLNLKPGDSVREGDTVVVLEVMKMEFPVEATTAGVVTEISVKEGELVKEGQLLARLERT